MLFAEVAVDFVMLDRGLCMLQARCASRLFACPKRILVVAGVACSYKFPRMQELAEDLIYVLDHLQ